MNYTTAVFLINDRLRAVKISYEPKPKDSAFSDDFDPSEEAWKTKHVKTFKTLDPTIKVGDVVVIPTKTRHGMTCGKVTEVDVPVDYDSNEEMKWVIGKVDKEGYDKIVDDEGKYIAEMRAAEELTKKEELKAKLKFNAEKMNQLAIANATSTKTVEQ